MTNMILLIFVIFVSCQGFLLDGNTQTATSGTSLDDKRYNILMNLLIEERRSRSKLESAVSRELLALRQEVTRCQCGSGNVGHSQIDNQGSLSNDTKALEEEIIHLKRDQELLKTEVAGFMQNTTVLRDKVMQLEQNLTIMQNTQCDLNLEKTLQVTDNKLNVVINDVNARKQDFIALFKMVSGLQKNHTELKDNVLRLERNLTMENTKCCLKLRNETRHLAKALQTANSKVNAAANEAILRNQKLITLSEKVAGLMQNNTVLKDNVIQLERNLTMENVKCRNETSHLERALQITNNKLNAIANDANARKQDLMALFQKVQSTEQRLENSTRSLEARQNMTFLRLQKDIINRGRLNIFELINIVFHSISKVKVKSHPKI